MAKKDKIPRRPDLLDLKIKIVKAELEYLKEYKKANTEAKVNALKKKYENNQQRSLAAIREKVKVNQIYIAQSDAQGKLHEVFWTNFADQTSFYLAAGLLQSNADLSIFFHNLNDQMKFLKRAQLEDYGQVENFGEEDFDDEEDDDDF